LNPSAALANKPIEVVVHGEARNIEQQFSHILGLVDPDFALLIPSSTTPPWPFAEYAKYSVQAGLDGPTGYVASNPYSISVAFASIAERLSVRFAFMLNHYGTIVSPNYRSIASGFDERAITTRRLENGEDFTEYNSDLTPGEGPMAWPFLFAVTLVINRDFSSQSCVVRSELVKFIRYMLNVADIKYELAISEFTSLISAETDTLLKVQSTLSSLTCNGVPISTDASDPIEIGGTSPVTAHVNTRMLWVEEFEKLDRVARYEYQAMDEGVAMLGLLRPDSSPDVLFFAPLTARRMYPNEYQNVILSEKAQTIHAGMFSIVFHYNLPPVAVARSVDAELIIDLETAALVFLGEIREWTDSRLTARNPQLIQAFVGVDTQITVVLCGRGLPSQSPLTPVGNHLALALNRTVAFRTAGVSMTLPVDWTEVAERRESLGAPSIFLPHEQSLESSVDLTPGSFGYNIDTGRANAIRQFRMVRNVKEKDGRVTENVVAPSYEALLALAQHTPPTSDISWVEENAMSDSPLFKDAWPLPMPISIAIETAASTLISTGFSASSICFRATRAVKFAIFMISYAGIAAASAKVGRGDLATLKEWREYFETELRKCTCEGEPILFVAPVIWEMPASVIDFSRWTGGIGLIVVAVTIGLVVAFKERTIIKVANLPFQIISLLGMSLLYSSALMYAEAPTSSSCSAIGWLVSVGAAGMFAPLCVKIVRVHYMASQQQRRSLRIKKLSNRLLFSFIAMWIALHIIVLGIAESKAQGILTPETVVKFEESRDHIYTQCSMVRSNAYSYIAVGLHSALLLLTFILSLGLMRVSSPFSESRHISWSLWNTLLSALIIIPLLLFTGGLHSDTGCFLVVFFLIWVTGGTMGMTFGWKMYHLFYEEWHVYRSIRSTASGISSAAVSSHLTKSSKTDGSSGLIGTDEQLDIEAAMQFPSLLGVSLVVLEKYITALETQIRMARAKRTAVFGKKSTVPVGGYKSKGGEEEEEDRELATIEEKHHAPSSSPTTPFRPHPFPSLSIHVNKHPNITVELEMLQPSSPVRMDALKAKTPATGSGPSSSPIQPQPHSRAASPFLPRPSASADRPRVNRKTSLGLSNRAPVRISTIPRSSTPDNPRPPSHVEISRRLPSTKYQDNCDCRK
jgi:ABC-type phosphate transport system substrate-binding protein